jgi:hypothetical protein
MMKRREILGIEGMIIALFDHNDRNKSKCYNNDWGKYSNSRNEKRNSNSNDCPKNLNDRRDKKNNYNSTVDERSDNYAENYRDSCDNHKSPNIRNSVPVVSRENRQKNANFICQIVSHRKSAKENQTSINEASQNIATKSDTPDVDNPR